MCTTRRLALTAVLTAIVLIQAISPTPAGAAIGPVTGARLSVEYLGPIAANCKVSVDGLVRMSQTDAQGLINEGYKVVVRVWGEDPLYDDLMLGPYYLTPILPGASAYIAATTQGLKLHSDTAVNGSRLNEDRDPGPGGISDELYSGIRLVNRSGMTIRSAETNRVGGHNFGFGCQGRPPAG